MDTTQLVLRAQNNDQSAINELYYNSYRQAYSVAMMMTKNEQDAYDIMQEAYMKAFSSLDLLSDKSGFNPWLNKIVANKCKDFLRTKRNVVFFSDMSYDNGESETEIEFEDESDAFRPEAHTDYNETKRLIGEMLDNLPADQKMVLLMYYVQEMSIREIAETLNMSENTVKSRMSYGKKKLKIRVEALEKKGTKLRVSAAAAVPFLIWVLKENVASAPVHEMSPALQGTISAANAVSYAQSGAANALHSQSAVQNTAQGAARNQAAQWDYSQNAWNQNQGYPQAPVPPQQPAVQAYAHAEAYAQAQAFASAAAKPVKHTARNLLIVLLCTVIVAGGGFFFTAFALPNITGKQNFISRLFYPEEKITTPEKLVEKFENAFNNGDVDGMVECYLPSQRSARRVQGSSLEVFRTTLTVANGGSAPHVDCTLKDLQIEGNTASGTVVILAETVLTGQQTLNSSVTFRKQDGEWFFEDF